MASDVSMLPPLSSVRQDSDWEFDEAIREALGLGFIPEVQLQGIVLKSGHPSLLDHDYIKLEVGSENSFATQPSKAAYPEEESSGLESEATDNDEIPKYVDRVDLDSETSTATQPSESTTTNILKDNVEKEIFMQTKPTAFKFRPVSTTDGPRPSKSMKTCNKTYLPKPKDRVIYFSLETTGMNRVPYQKQEGVQICCMAAYYNGDMFEAYLTPTKNFQPGATAYNGMKLSRGVLTKNGKKVECAESMVRGLKRFIEWLNNNACDDQTGQLILVAHNSTNFHAVVLMKNLRIVGLKLPSKVVFADTMDIMSQIKDKSHGRLQKLTLDASMRFFFNNEGQGGHDANSTTMKLVELAHAAARHLGFDNFPNYLMSNTYSIKQTYVIC